MAPRRLIAAIAVAVLLVAGVVAYVVLSDSSDSGSSLEPGIPVDKVDTADSIAFSAIDEDPANGQLFTRCRFAGIADGSEDVYMCNVRYVGYPPITLRLEHERDGPRYRVVLVRPRDLEGGTSDWRDGVEICTHDGNPRCH